MNFDENILFDNALVRSYLFSWFPLHVACLELDDIFTRYV